MLKDLKALALANAITDALVGAGLLRRPRGQDIDTEAVRTLVQRILLERL